MGTAVQKDQAFKPPRGAIETARQGARLVEKIDSEALQALVDGRSLPLSALRTFKQWFDGADEQAPEFLLHGGADGRAWIEKVLKQVGPDLRSLYVYRPLKNTEDIILWAKAQGFPSTVQSGDLHVTIAFSRDQVDWSRLAPRIDELRVVGGDRTVEPLGDKGALVLRFDADDLAVRWQQFRNAGAGWDWDGYRPHLTITYAGTDIDPALIAAYDGPLIFGPETFEEVNEDWTTTIIEKDASEAPFEHTVSFGDAKVLKVDDSLGLVMGYAIVSTINGEPYYDSQGDHIPQASMLEAAADFMQNSRVAGDMHQKADGTVVFCWPMTDEIAKAFGIEASVTGLMIAMRPDSEETLTKFRSGEYTGFSIGGMRIEEEVLDAAA